MVCLKSESTRNVSQSPGQRGGEENSLIENRAYWARPDSDIPAISETMHTSRSYFASEDEDYDDEHVFWFAMIHTA